jgi:hypothetical protein
MKTITFQISDEAFELLTKIGNGGDITIESKRIEYR